MHRIITFTIVLLFLCGSWAYAADLNFSASVDRNTLSPSESLTLTIQLEGKAANVPDPQLPDLSDFNLLSGPNESSSFQFINGQTSFSKQWSFVLNPKRDGQITIGSAQLTLKGQTLNTNPITITVSGPANPPPTTAQTPAPQSGNEPAELFVRVTADNTNIYQNQQVVLTYTIYWRITLNGYEISKLPNTPGFWQEEFQLGQPPNVRNEIISGHHYRAAVVRQVALFPTRSGDLTMDPLEVTCQVQVQDTQRKRRDPFDMFFDSPFARFRTEQRAVATQSLTLHVKPLPGEGKPADFSGAVGDFSLQVNLDKQTAKTNEALTMVVTFSGSGNIKTLPKPNFTTPSDFETYDPKESVQVNKTSGRVSGSKTYEYVLIPRAPGKSQIPPIAFSYFDPAARTYRTLKQGGFEINVQKGTGEVASSSLPGVAKEDVKLLAEDIHYLKTPARLLSLSPPQTVPAGYWMLMVLPPLLAVGLWWGSRIIGGAALQAKLRSRKAYDRARRELRNFSKSVTGLTQSAKPEAIFGGVHKVVLDFIGEKLGLPASGLKEEDILEKLAGHGLAAETVNEIKEIFLECNFARFTSGSVEAQHRDQILKRAELVIDQIEANWGKKA